MKTPGTLLREAREGQGLSLYDVAALTYIPRLVLQNLEKDRYDEFAAEVFYRGHARSYAREVGLDAEAVIRAYEATTSSAERPAHPTPRMNMAPAPDVGRDHLTMLEKLRAPHMLGGAAFMFALVVVLTLLTGTRATAEDRAAFPTTSEARWELEDSVQETRWLLEAPGPVSTAR